jgi:hypothetical protein
MAAAAVAAAEEADWWFSDAGAQKGPVTRAQLEVCATSHSAPPPLPPAHASLLAQALLADGSVDMGTFVWEEGADDWTTLEEVRHRLSRLQAF